MITWPKHRSNFSLHRSSVLLWAWLEDYAGVLADHPPDIALHGPGPFTTGATL